MSEFDRIHGFEGWKDKLGELLDEGKKAVAAEDPDQCRQIARRLTQFTVESFPNTPDIKELDRKAAEAAATLSSQSIDGMLAELATHTADVARLAEKFNAAVKANAAEADAIRLKRGKQVIDAVTGTVSALNQFRETLDSKDDKKLLEDLKSVATSLQKLRNAVESKE
jgi:hypothetical protein